MCLCTMQKYYNDHPPACSPGIGKDGKQVFKLQWPNHASDINVTHKCVIYYYKAQSDTLAAS